MASVKINPFVTISSIAKLGVALHLAQSGDPSLLLRLASSAFDLSSAIEFTKKPNMLIEFQTLLRKSVRSTLDEHVFVFEEDQIDEIIDMIFSVEHLQDYLGDNALDLLRENFIAALDDLDYPYKEHDLDVDRVLELILEIIDTEIDKDPNLAILDIRKTVHRLDEKMDQLLQCGHAVDRFPKYLTGLEPFQQDDILHREKDIAALTEKLASDEKMVLISGIGGVGKTLLARAVCEAMKEHFKHIAWLQYDGDLDAQLLKLDLWPQNSDLNSRLIQIKTFLKTIEEPVLIILDNIEAPPSRETLSTLNSFSPSVRLLLTSRLPQIPGVETYPLEFLSLEACIDVFYAAYTRDEKREHCEVVEKMITSVSRHTLTVELLALSAQGDADMLPNVWRKLQDAGFAYSDLEVENFHEPDPQTIQQRIQRLYDLAGMDEAKRKILRVFSILPHSSPIPFKIIEWMPCNPNDLNWLVDRGWLQQIGNDLYLHQVIQESLRMQEVPSVEDLRGLLVSFSTREYIPEDMVYTEAATRLALSEALIVWLEPQLEDALFAALLACTASFYEMKQANYTKALEYHKKALEIREKVNGRDHSDTAYSYNNLGILYRVLGHFKMALDYHQKALSIRKNILVSYHPDIADTHNNIAIVYSELEKHQKAIEHYQLALEIYVKVFGTNHPATASTLRNLAGVYHASGDAKKALKYCQKSLEICIRELGDDHPDTAATYQNLGLVYHSLNKTDIAIDSFKKSLAVKEKVLSIDHPDIAITLINLAGVYKDQGDYPLALELFLKAYLILFSSLGAQHPKSITIKRYLQAAFDQANVRSETFDVWLQDQLEQHRSLSGGSNM